MRALVLFLFALSLLTARPAWARQQGTVALTEAQARVDLARDYIFYGPAEARRIIVEDWGNPAAEADGVLGLVVPTGDPAAPWGAVVTWQPVGWVSNEDARATDYAAMMARMQAEAGRANAARGAGGFPAVRVIGWAQEPRYDSVRHAVTWGRELAFADGGPSALHYDLRLLGRRGVLSFNIVGTMDQLPEIRAAAQDLAGRAAFDPGARYEDYRPASDDAAGYGVAGLVAGGAGVALAKNLGLLAMLGKFAAPLGLMLLALGALLFAPVRKLLRPGRAPATR